MKLELHERLALMTLLPKKGDYAGLKVIRRCEEMLSPTIQEKNDYNMRNVIGQDGKPMVTWDEQKTAGEVKDIPIDEYMMNVFRLALVEMDKKKMLTIPYISIFEKFVVMYR